MPANVGAHFKDFQEQSLQISTAQLIPFIHPMLEKYTFDDVGIVPRWGTLSTS